jgi:putative transposase
MSRSRHSEAQIIAALKQVGAGRTADGVTRECGVSKHTIYAWKAKFGGMDASEAQKLRALEDENGRLKNSSSGLYETQVT